jgi:hypothetical protein
MQPHTNLGTSTSAAHKSDGGARVRHRSVSNADETAGPASPLFRQDSREAYATNADLHRRNTTGNKFAEGLKRRFGSLRKKKVAGEGY